MRIAFFSAALMASSLASAAVAIDGWYASVFGGYSYVPDNVSNTTYGVLRAHPSYNSGWNGGGRVGFQSTPLRYEAEVTYINANLKKFKINTIRQFGVDGESTGTFAMANVYYDFPEMVPCIAPFLGVGLGYGYITARLNSTGPVYGAAYPTRFKVDDNVWAFQGTAGFTYNFSENYAVNIAYRYIQTERADDFNKVWQAHLASVGAIYRFDGATYQ
ncbi:outer membrane protein [Legionella jordanis]|uniref:Opacity protein-like surface antigen n=1 Tax=Legionella jordanis TaxID=456 RepID=A0A0W0VG38_9GAMM|nr:outer membrane beta-barrel protein [Legionella jordanis]KTD19003.1 opacity protein-like surface antigen [Legionella jordanis]RMX05436.1 porin family protein [Legionella jordanis]RMX19119.1 porin family protein [Legionella jordanis]VEH13105.1 opacity protein-like surface antigen [Legionella jordanis]HAT8714766.1 outer membrane beta-barrel protein [Legionella jordanis]